ncbi:MAG: ATP-dependent DNA helicase RecG [Bacteroidaceae bacterium]
MYDIFLQDIKYLKGIGPSRSKLLNDELGIFSLNDLLYFFPFKYIDRSSIYFINHLQVGMPFVQLKGKIISFNTEGEGRKRRLSALFSDGTGTIELIWFAGIKFIAKSLKFNQTYVLLGKPISFNGKFSISHPEMDEIGTRDSDVCLRLQPYYHTTDRMKRHGLTSKTMEQIIKNLFAQIQDKITETLPLYLLSEQKLIGLSEALYQIHQPTTSNDLPSAERRLKFEELFYLQLNILRYAKDRKLKYRGNVFSKVGENFLQFFNEHLPFVLTEAQKRVIKEIRKDLGSGRQMNRLLQGDVGSGKTMVALMTMLIALDNGYQVCLMAPTEILVEQHFTTIRNLLHGMNITVDMLTGFVRGQRRVKLLENVLSGQIKILIGTHALLEETVAFSNLGMVVIDEQHRFGVAQRAKLWTKNVKPPHVLVMTATPIPRTLAMTVYGDLDVSVIDELPPGRKPIETRHYFDNNICQIYSGIHHEIELGHQVYMVYPLIKESEKIDIKNLEDGFIRISQLFPQYKIGKLHGKMKSAEKDAEMQRFVNGETKILVATTVIEVGVNVPNASVMIIENAERFGLAQLHQLRGRVGRGAKQSYCLLITGHKLSETTTKRMQIMVETTDGFEIAEEDLKLRGPGDLDGVQQSGIAFDLKIANITKDNQLLQLARDVATQLLNQDSECDLPQNEIIWHQLRKLRKTNVNWSSIS